MDPGRLAASELLGSSSRQAVAAASAARRGKVLCVLCWSRCRTKGRKAAPAAPAPPAPLLPTTSHCGLRNCGDLRS